MLVRVLETVDLTLGEPGERGGYGERGGRGGAGALSGLGGLGGLGGPKHRALLHCLALRANSVVPVEELLVALWDGPPPRTARKMVQNVVSELRSWISAQEWSATARRAPRAALLTHGSGYVLRVDPDEVDALAFTRQARAGLAQLAGGEENEALGTLRSALALWPTLTPAPGPSARWPERRALEELRDSVVRQLAAGAGAVLLLSTEHRRSAADAGAAFGHEMRLGREIRDQIDRRQGLVCTEFGSLRVAAFPDDLSPEPALSRARAAAEAVRERLGTGHPTTVTALLMPDRTIQGGRTRVPAAVVDEGLAALAVTPPGTIRVHGVVGKVA